MDALDRRLLLAHATGKSKDFFLSHPEYTLGLFEKLRFTYYSWQRNRGVPLAYITHHQEFYGLDFYINKHVLVPRPDTETLVEAVLTALKNTTAPVTLVDVGTGSGCIPISIAKHAHLKNIFAVDISRGALRVATHNARTQNVFINFAKGNLLEPIAHKLQNEQNIFITANLPYLTAEQVAAEPSIQHEPHLALVAAHGGLALIEALLQQALALHGKSTTIFLEFDPRQTTQLVNMINKLMPSARVAIKKDLAGRDRVAQIVC